MKKMRSILSRFRLLTNVLALAFVLSAYATPAPAQDIGILYNFMCSSGCVDWEDGVGCLACEKCCSSRDWWFCVCDNDPIC
jgi:hypothetical protein